MRLIALFLKRMGQKKEKMRINRKKYLVGISFGFITYTLTRVLEKKKVSKLVWVLTVIFLLYLIFGL